MRKPLTLLPVLSGGPAGIRGKTVNTLGELQLPRNEKVLTLLGMAGFTGTLLRACCVNGLAPCNWPTVRIRRSERVKRIPAG
ncbi:hypothetical protein [Parapedobacter soli]|uniref:hypothetical protein n=1 Tax=Parapedobacter soli TaxID=416955 RepID=UPI0021C9919D|nr:hypothetical protein [Parapedobacter soli]